MDPMLIWGLGLLGAALLILALEVFVPSGGLLAIAAAVVALAGVVCLYFVDEWLAVTGFVTMLVLGVSLSYFGVTYVLPNTPIGRKMLGQEEGERPTSWIEQTGAGRVELIGRDGIAVTDLRPVGVVRIGTERIEALAETGMIDAGSKVRVVRVSGNEIKVRPV